MGYRFEKLTVWQKSMDFCTDIYAISKYFPKDEIYGLTSQLRRAATSIPLNIAEGSACRTKKEFVQFLYIALRSQYEVATILKLVSRLGYINKDDFAKLNGYLDIIGKLIQGLINSMKSDRST